MTPAFIFGRVGAAEVVAGAVAGSAVLVFVQEAGFEFAFAEAAQGCGSGSGFGSFACQAEQFEVDVDL